MSTVVQFFVGEYDLAHQLSLRADFDSLRDEAEVVLDLTAVTYLDSTFVNELLRLNTHRVERGLRPPSIVRSALALKRIFSLLYFGALFRLVDTLEQALFNDGKPVVYRHAHPGNDANAPDIAIYSTESGSPTPVWNSLGADLEVTFLH
jgi:anti-anti-sigma regulatory factor